MSPHLTHLILLFSVHVVNKEGFKKETRLKPKKNKTEPHVGVTDGQTGPKTPSMQKYIWPPNLSSLVADDEFDELLIVKL